jgi:GT2 family glycosyltransferase
MKSGNVMVTSSVVVRKQILEQVGGLDEDASIVASEDYDLCLRIARATERFTYIPRSLGAYWMGGGNMTEISERQIERMEAVYRKHMAFLKEEDRQDVVTIINYGRARILQKMGHAMESAALFRETLRTRMLNIKIKSLYCLVISYLQGRCRQERAQ